MAGHSKFKNIMHRKGAQDKKRANIFTKLAREIYVSAKLGGDNMEFNPRLRTAIAAAKAQNMPKDKIDAAIKKATSAGDGENYTEIRYEGYGPQGVALMIEVLTDNKNRSATDVRTILNKNGGSLGESGSVSYMFKRLGVIEYNADAVKEEEIFEKAIELGVDDCVREDDTIEIITSTDIFNDVVSELEESFGQAKSAEITYRSDNMVELDLESAEKVIRLVGLLEDNDDVQRVVGNFSIPDAVIAQL